MSVMPTDPIYSKLLVTACKPQFRQIAEDVAAIVAMLSVENIFYQMTNLDAKNQKDKLKLKAIKKRKRFSNQHSDHLALLMVLKEFVKISGRQQPEFCNEYLLNFKSIQKAVQIWHQLTGYMSRVMSKHQDQSAIDNNSEQLIVMCLLEGLPLNRATLSHGNVYLTANKEECSLHPSSSLFGSALQIKTVIYSEIVQTTKTYMRCVTDVSHFADL